MRSRTGSLPCAAVALEGLRAAALADAAGAAAQLGHEFRHARVVGAEVGVGRPDLRLELVHGWPPAGGGVRGIIPSRARRRGRARCVTETVVWPWCILQRQSLLR